MAGPWLMDEAPTGMDARTGREGRQRESPLGNPDGKDGRRLDIDVSGPMILERPKET